MRCKPFDQQTREALRRLGFTIADDGASAKITDEMTVEIIRPDHPKIFDEDEFLLTVELPNGTELVFTPRRKLLNAAGSEPDEGVTSGRSA